MVDFSLNTDNVVAGSDADIILQEIDILFETHPKDVLGQEEFGTRYDKFLYDLQISTDAIQQTVLQDISDLELFGYRPDVKVYLLEGILNDILLISITLTRGGETYQKIYKISE